MESVIEFSFVRILNLRTFTCSLASFCFVLLTSCNCYYYEKCFTFKRVQLFDDDGVAKRLSVSDSRVKSDFFLFRVGEKY